MFIEILINVGLMVAGYLLFCSAISFAIDHYFKTKEEYDNKGGE